MFRLETWMFGLFRGLIPIMLRQPCLEWQILVGSKDISCLGKGSQILTSGVVGVTFWISMNPTYVTKSVIQVDDYHNPKYCGTMDDF